MNNHTINLVSISILIFVFVIIIMSCTPQICSDDSGWSVDNTPNASLSDEEIELLTLINGYRGSNGYANLLEEKLQSVSAQRHANDMANRSYFNSITLDCGWDSYDRAVSSNTEIKSEIYADDEINPMDAFNRFKSNYDSELLGDYATIGIGEKGGYWVVNFY